MKYKLSFLEYSQSHEKQQGGTFIVLCHVVIKHDLLPSF